tara:strand:+ start:529 stop:831 length:303 start_codon:yes stop_codon:yes gene_type:complete
MYPFLKDGDIVFYKTYSVNKSSLKIGDIVIFKHPILNINSVKRITKLSEYGVEVCGDNKEFSKDSRNFFGFIQKERIIGIVMCHITNYRFLNLKNLLRNK